jgi:rhodanese-related sulfurtransferase
MAWGQELPIAFITVADVHRLLERGAEVLFVDVRSQQEYLARHITGALSIPLRTLEERYQELPRERLVVLY